MPEIAADPEERALVLERALRVAAGDPQVAAVVEDAAEVAGRPRARRRCSWARESTASACSGAAEVGEQGAEEEVGHHQRLVALVAERLRQRRGGLQRGDRLREPRRAEQRAPPRELEQRW